MRLGRSFPWPISSTISFQVLHGYLSTPLLPNVCTTRALSLRCLSWPEHIMQEYGHCSNDPTLYAVTSWLTLSVTAEFLMVKLHLTVSGTVGFVDPKTNNFPGSMAAYCSDGASIVIGSLMGTSPVTVFVGTLQDLCT